MLRERKGQERKGGGILKERTKKRVLGEGGKEQVSDEKEKKVTMVEGDGV